MDSSWRKVLEDVLEPLAVDLSAIVALSHFWRICNHLVWSVTTLLDSCRSVLAGHWIKLINIPNSLPKFAISAGL